MYGNVFDKKHFEYVLRIQIILISLYINSLWMTPVQKAAISCWRVSVAEYNPY